MLKNRRILLTGLFIILFAVIFGVIGKFNLKNFPQVFDKNFWDLLILVILVQAVTQAFKVNNYDQKVLDFVSKTTGDLRFTLVIPPLIFGLLPMPAGAMLTADLTQKAGENFQIKSKWLFFFNYWFRHVCEFSWPLYGALILSAGIAGIPVKNFLLVTFLYMAIAIAVGLIYLYTKVRKTKNGNKENISIPSLLLNSLRALWPVLLLIALIMLKVEMKLAVLLTLLLIFIMEKTKISKTLEILKNSIFSEITFIVFVVLIFKGIVERTNTLNLFANFLIRHHVPQMVPVIILPMSMAFLSGITSAGIGATAPLLKGLFQFNHYFPYLAYVSAISGVLLSPFHLCFITTKEYYKIDFKDAYSTVILPVLAVEIVAIIHTLI